MQVFVYICTGIVTEVTFTFTYFLYYNRTFLTSVSYNLTKRFFDGTLDDFDTCSFICIVTFQAFQCIDGTDVSYTTTRYDTFFDSGTSCTQGIIYTVFLFLHFYFTGSTYVKNCYTT